jgi:NlpC/P60 family
MNFWRFAPALFYLILILPAGSGATLFPSHGPTVPGTTACLRNGVACAPEKAPLPVKRAIWAANQLRKSPYRYGGGHRSFWDSGYDCSGTVSFALAAAGLINLPMSSNELAHYGAHGRGKWITVYARNGHAFAVIAGLRLDTTAWNDRDPDAPRWRVDGRPPSDFETRHPAGL